MLVKADRACFISSQFKINGSNSGDPDIAMISSMDFYTNNYTTLCIIHEHRLLCIRGDFSIMRKRNLKRQIGILINDQFHPLLLFPPSELGTMSVIELSVLEHHALALVKCVSLQEWVQSQNLYPWAAETDNQTTEHLPWKN